MSTVGCMSDDAAADRLSDFDRQAFLKRMIAVGFAVPLVTTFEPSDAAAQGTSTSPTPTSAPPTTSVPTTSPTPPTPQALITDVQSQMAALAASGNPKLADKAEDVHDKLTVALVELAKTPPDGAAALGTLEGAAGDLQAMVKDRLLSTEEGGALMDTLAAAGRLLAEQAIADAITRSRNPGKITDAQSALAAGDARWIAGRYKDALSRYKDAYAKAAGA